jgi:hypothetical protein
VVTSANGFLASPAQVGRYPILDTRAAIDRANAAMGEVPAGVEGDVGAASSDAGTTGTGTADVPGTADVTTTQCAALMPECGYEIDDPGATEPCKVQPDGAEICSYDPCPPATTIPGEAPPEGDECPLLEVSPCVEAGAEAGTTTGAVAPGDEPVESPAILRCTPPDVQPEPEPQPEPAPIEVVLVDAEPALQLLAAVDGSTDAYLVPAYRFTAVDGSTVDLPAVADDALAAPNPPEPATTETVAPPPPETVPPGPVDPCEVLEEGDATATTHTIVSDPACDPQGAVELGVPYDVAVIAHCGHISDFDGRWWSTVDVVTNLGAEAGALTLEAPDLGTFEGGGVTATFEARGPAEEYPGCD